MSGSVDEVRAGLAVVSELLGSAGQCTARAAAMIDEALAALTRLSEQHSESLVPAELRRAADEVHRGLALLQDVGVAVSDIDARL